MNEEILERLQRLRNQVDISIGIVKNTPGHITHGIYILSDSPNTFHVGDFVIKDRLWVKNGPTTEDLQNPT